MISAEKNSFKILGVDPGTNITGYGLIQIEGKACRIIDIGYFDLRQQEDQQSKLKEIFLQLQEVIETYLPSHMAIEAPFFGKNVQSMLKLGRAQGVAMAAAMTMGIQITEYSPKKIKQAITGNGNASKEQVCAMLKQRMGLVLEDKYLDASDALAVAVCHWQQMNDPSTSNTSKKYNGWANYIKENTSRVSK